MSFLEKWSPATDLERLRHEFDELLERFGFGRGELTAWPAASNRPAIESSIDGDKFVVRVDLPGVDPGDIDTIVVGDMLVVKAKREEKKETKKRDLVRREVSYGSYERAMKLPEGVKAEDIKASYRDGVLELTAPAPKELVPKEVRIQVEGTQPKKIETEKAAA